MSGLFGVGSLTHIKETISSWSSRSKAWLNATIRERERQRTDGSVIFQPSEQQSTHQIHVMETQMQEGPTEPDTFEEVEAQQQMFDAEEDQDPFFSPRGFDEP